MHFTTERSIIRLRFAARIIGWPYMISIVGAKADINRLGANVDPVLQQALQTPVI